MKPSILFIDDEPNILQGLQRNLRKMRDEWDMTFVGSGGLALDYIASNPVDLVLTDMRMPVMDGAELLTKVAKSSPRTIRFVLSGQTDQEESIRLVEICHQFLTKPCNIDLFVHRAQRALALRDILPDDDLQSQVTGLTELPSQPAVYDEIVKEFSFSEPSVEKIAALISQDIALTAKLLKIAAWEFFNTGRSTPGLTQAVEILGMKRVEALVRTSGVVKKYEGSDTGGISLEDLWNHGSICAILSQAIAKAEGFDPKTIESTFVAGLVHDIGRLLLAASEPEKYKTVLAGAANPDGKEGSLAEAKAFRATHATIGAYLVGLWGFPEAIIRAVAYHHTPLDCPDQDFGVLTVLHAAEGFSFETINSEAEAGSQLDIEYFEALGLTDKLAEWRRIASHVMNGELVT